MISVIIPTHNEEKAIRKTLSSFSKSTDNEIIVVDGASSDKTVDYAQDYPVSVISIGKNRARQLNQGAKAAKGEILVFLHADCTLEPGSLQAINDCIKDGFLGGAFNQKIESSRKIYRLIEASGNIRAKLFKVFYGDQVIFVRKDTFLKIGGFDKVDLFDDVMFSRKLNKEGKSCLLNKKVYSSARRWESQGIVKTTLINWLVTLGFTIGLSPQTLKKLYREVR